MAIIVCRTWSMSVWLGPSRELQRRNHWIWLLVQVLGGDAVHIVSLRWVSIGNMLLRCCKRRSRERSRLESLLLSLWLIYASSSGAVVDRKMQTMRRHYVVNKSYVQNLEAILTIASHTHCYISVKEMHNRVSISAHVDKALMKEANRLSASISRSGPFHWHKLNSLGKGDWHSIKNVRITIVYDCRTTLPCCYMRKPRCDGHMKCP